MPDKTKEVIVSGNYSAASGSFDACNLIVNGTLNMNGGTTNYVKVIKDLTISGNFTIGDTEALVQVNDDGAVSGSITKLESSTTLNNWRDFTYWSSPVAGATVSVFTSTGIRPNRVFQWQEPSSGNSGEWLVASGNNDNR